MLLGSAPVFLVLCFALCASIDSTVDSPIRLNSNAIKTSPDGVTNSSQVTNPKHSPRVADAENIAIDLSQTPNCANDEECGANEFCHDSRGACMKCRRPRKRCARDKMCCSGSRCVTGVCLPSNDRNGVNRTLARGSRRTHLGGAQALKGQEGDSCLRSSDCARGLCCARHFWSRICKPVLTDGQVCSRHKRKGSQGMEIFQRCSCGDGLTCRALKGHNTSTATGRLNTCQRR